MAQQQFKLVFHSGNYSCIDYVGPEENCYDVKAELAAQMRASGETDFYYTVEKA